MLATLALAGLALRSGLKMRGRRLAKRPPRAELRALHLRVAPLAVLASLLGFAGGLASSLWLRGWTPFERAHAWLAVLALLLFVAAGATGNRLKQGALDARTAHGLAGLLALLVAAVASVAGFVLLP